MDDAGDNTTDRYARPARRTTLTKNPPPPALTNFSKGNALARTPSAPTRGSYSPSQSQRDYHTRTQSSTHGSSSSLIPANATQSQGLGAFGASNQNTQRGADDLIGEPFDGQGILSSLNTAAVSNDNIQPPSSARPQPPPLNHTHTSPDLRSHQVRQSQSFSQGTRGAMEITPPRSDNGTTSPKRYSDEAGKPPGPFRKKSGFSSFMNSMLGSPKTIKISAPENPVHMIHVGYDNVTGQFTVRLPSDLLC